MNRKIWIAILLGMFIGVISGFALMSVGEMQTIRDKPYGWDLPLNMFMVLAIPAYLGYLLGKE